MRVPSRRPRFASRLARSPMRRRPTGLQCANPFAAAPARFPMHGTHDCARELFPGKEGFVPSRSKPDRRPKWPTTLMIPAAIRPLRVPGAPAQADMPPKPPAAKNDAATAAPHDTAKFIAAQNTDQWVFSKFKGTDVLGPDNAH